MTDVRRIFKRLMRCFVTLGVSLNVGAHAAILGFALVAGNFIVPTIMAKYGRRTANIVSIVTMIVGWFCIVTATNITALLVARFLQGSAMGMTASLGPVLIGEYTSPQNRGAFLATISLSVSIGVLFVHTLGSCLHWQVAGLVCACLMFFDLLIVLYSPETPSWLSDQGRYEESEKVFRWLRGDNDNEDEELKRMIESSMITKESRAAVNISESFSKRLRNNLVYFTTTIQKKEFYKPIFIMVHIYTLSQWGGANILAAYTIDVFSNVIGNKFDIYLMVITLGTQRIISNAMAVYIIKKVKRRTMLLATVGINITACLTLAAYTYLKAHNMLPFDLPIIGVLLIHIHMFTIATGTVPLPFIIAGEVFPLEYRSLAGSISIFFLSANFFINVKTFPYFLQTISIYGAYLVYTAIVGYCLLIAYFFLPETKDRTLQEIEDEFRGRPLSPEELKSTQSLTANSYNQDRRCSAPAI
ncbi:unnamed protein product [Leptidea sinapis]|uniref:Major facilitator superfamily (MFS) profile domain-containing protein n=1 Tax=Leptidea sinapis TaxID=189913 RepID=A0A5E4PU02_9NEOP|nr:unnamed protein product [Leptidea sinapis]